MPQIIKIDENSTADKTFKEISQNINKGTTFIYPTETFYGIGAYYDDVDAIKKIFKVKGRDHKKPLPLLIPDIDSLVKITAEINPKAMQAARRFWPGPLTIVFKASDSVSRFITADTGTVACRVSGYLLVNRMLITLGALITSTSANLTGEKSASSIDEINPLILNSVDFVIDGGQTKGELPTTILDTVNEPFKVLRQGPIPASVLLEYCSSTT